MEVIFNKENHIKIIALEGSENSGKSHVINIVYQFLICKGWEQESGNYEELGDKSNEDILDVLLKDGIRLGIIGMGDYIVGKNSLRHLIERLIEKDCKIIICTFRTDKPKIRIAIEQSVKPILLEVIKIKEQLDKSRYRFENNKYAKMILEKI